MKRWTWVMVLAAMTAPGCVTVPNKNEEPPPPVAMKESQPRPPIMPEEVNENNAGESFARLSEEVERQQNAAPPGQR